MPPDEATDSATRTRWRWLAAIWAMALVVVLWWPRPDLPPLFAHADKVFHFGAFLVFGVLAVRGPPDAVARRERAELWTIAIAVVLAVVTEVGQSWLDMAVGLGRLGEGLDGAADVVGAAVGTLTAPARRSAASR